MWRLLLCSLLAVSAGNRVRRIVGGYEAEPPLAPEVAQKLSVDDEPAPTPLPAPPTTNEAEALPSPPPANQQPVSVRGITTPEGHNAFLGIRYAVPPVGKLRFQRPRREYLHGTVNATDYGLPCAQIDSTTGRIVGNEDCLYLNVYTPSNVDGTKLPVFFWIHGGHFASGSGNQYNPQKLVSEGIIVVTIQYRLGILGFMSLNSEEMPGNQGLFDCAAALRWTRHYIAAFGGDAKQITVGGQGSGASLATYLAINKFTTNMVQGVVAMSGTALSPFSVDKDEISSSSGIADAAGGTCKQSMAKVDYIKCMQNLPVEKILRGEFEVAKKKRKVNGLSGVASLLVPAVSEDKENDDRYLPSFLEGSPLDLMQKAKLNHPIPMLTGVTKEETGGAMKGSFWNQLKQFPQQTFTNNFFKDLHLANKGLHKNKTADSTLTSLFSTSAYTDFFKTLLKTTNNHLTKLIKATTDAFFNLPVFVTSHLWSSKSTIYLYSFEQEIKESSSDKFLNDLALSGQTTTKEAHHGDDLIYLFDPQTLFGDPIQVNNLEADDLLISKYMINSVSSFVRDGKPVIKEGVSWTPFSAKKNNYMIISTNPREANDFHKCDMGLWSADRSILESNECSAQLPGIKNVLDSVPGVKSLLRYGNSGVDSVKQGISSATKPITDTIGSIAKPLGSLPRIGGFGSGGLRTLG